MDDLYILARRVLLDALEALKAHLESLILVGSQAIYLQVGESDLAIAPYTTDGDIAINPELLADIPPIEQELSRANFQPESEHSVGIWVAHHPVPHDPYRKVAVDLLVPKALYSGKGRRAARMTGHHKRSARLVDGLEGAVVNFEMMTISALADTDNRSFSLKVAGTGALLIAKAFKIADREGMSRQNDKDALDVFRILRGTETMHLCRQLHLLLEDDRSRKTAMKGVDLLRNQFLTKSSIGVKMVIRATELLADPDEMASSCIMLAEDMFSSL